MKTKHCSKQGEILVALNQLASRLRTLQLLAGVMGCEESCVVEMCMNGYGQVDTKTNYSIVDSR